MAVHYHSIDGELVSDHWIAFLSSARADGVPFHINEGHRTLARQTYFWNCYITKRCNNGNLAARPSPYAPHIRSGRQDHAIDANNLQGIINYGRRHGVTITRTVRGEEWHGEANAAQLAAFYHSHGGAAPDKYKALTKAEKGWVNKLFYHRKKMAQGIMYASNLGWARYFKARLRVRANLLYRLGKRDGWKKLNRGERQKIIRAIVNDPGRIS